MRWDMLRGYAMYELGKAVGCDEGYRAGWKVGFIVGVIVSTAFMAVYCMVTKTGA